MLRKDALALSLVTFICASPFALSAPDKLAVRSFSVVAPPAINNREASTVDQNDSIEFKESANKKYYPIFFVTNRQPGNGKDGALKFTNDRSDTLTYGKYLPGEDAADMKQATAHIFASQNDFLSALKATGSKKAAVFVHGYRKSFSGSIDFGMKMADHLDAPLVVFAWPSKNNYCKYMVDECTAEWSSHHLSQVLRQLGNNLGYHNLILVSHSLGARMVQWGLRDLYTEDKPAEPFAAALFFSPDVDRDSFVHDAPFLKQACGDCRLYLDDHDTRIRISKFMHGSPRIGSFGKGPKEEQALTNIFHCDTSLPSHHIPFELVSNSVHQISESEKE
jgi:esterase/lipase superfamily enzyme